MTLFEQIIKRSGTNSPAQNQLQNAVVVMIDNVAEYLVSKNRGINHLLADHPILTPPYPVMWFEYQTVVSTETEKRFGFLTQRIKNQGHLSVIVTEFQQDSGRQKGIDLGQGCSITHKYLIDLDRTGTLIKVNTEYQLAALASKGLTPGSIGQLNVILTALSILNCENSSLETISMMGNKPVHAIAIGSISTRSDEENHRHTTEIRSGHQKDFRAGDGLFGKHHGVYWWSV